MTETQATVTALDGAYAIVRAEQQGGCGRCNEPGGCGGNNLVQMMCGAPREYRVLNPDGAKLGESVTVCVAEGVVSRTAVLMYGVPLVFLFLGTVVGSVLWGNDWSAVAGGMAGLVTSWLIIKKTQRGVGDDRRFQPTILVRH